MTTETLHELGRLERHLLDDFQHDFPLVTRPYAAVARHLGVGEAEVLDTLRRLQREGVVSRVGPVFRPHAVGTSTLAAMAVPPERLEEVAHTINGYPEVNHNYEREHAFNLWFVATAVDEAHLAATLADMERRTGLAVMSLPMLEAYHIDLGFRLQWGARAGGSEHETPVHRPRHGGPAHRPVRNCDAVDRRLVQAVQAGLPLTACPYAKVAQDAGLEEWQVIARLGDWLEEGILSRLGVVVRHRKLGYRANAMVVWDVPDQEVTALGRCLGGYDFVTLCYRRPRRLPQWRYNLFCMIHGRDRETVVQRVEWLVQHCGLQSIDHELLFSRRSFKQRGARYDGSPRPAASVAEHTALEQRDG